MEDGVEQGDDVSGDFERVGDENDIIIDAQETFGEAGFAISGGPVKEQGFLRDERGAKLIEEGFGKDEVAEGATEAVAVDVHVGGLLADGVVVGFERDRRGAGIGTHSGPLRGEGFAGGGEPEIVVITLHAFDIEIGLLAQLPEDGIEHHVGQFQAFAEIGEIALALFAHGAHEEILDEDGRYIEGGESIGLGGPESGRGGGQDFGNGHDGGAGGGWISARQRLRACPASAKDAVNSTPMEYFRV